MSKTTVRVVARFAALPAHQEELRSILTDLVEPTRQESGCIHYQLLQNQEDLTDFVFVEEWESEALLILLAKSKTGRRGKILRCVALPLSIGEAPGGIVEVLQLQTISPVPEQTSRVARAAFPKGNLYITMRDEIGTLYNDQDFEALFPTHGQPAFSPWRLALICVMQFIEELSDRQAAEAVRSRIDWKYVLALELTDPGFDFSVLCEFRARLIAGGSEQQLLDTLLKQFKERDWLKARGKQRTDSTHVLAAIRTLNRLEGVGETLRAALNALATVAPDWLCSWVPQEWFDRYGHAVDEYRLPKGIVARKEYAQTIGSDGMQLLIAIYDDETTPQWLRQIPVVEILRQTWVHQYYMDNGQVCWRAAADLPPAGNRFDSPYDPDARYGNKRSTTWTGYKVHVTETCDVDSVHLITNVETTHAHLSDVDQTEPIHKALSAKALLPCEHIVDAGGR